MTTPEIPAGTWTARDLWTNQSNPISNGTLEADIDPHGVTILRLTQPESPAKN